MPFSEYTEIERPLGFELPKQEIRESLPVVEVQNTTLWVNPNMSTSPFKFEVGQPNKLGFFLTPNEKAGTSAVEILQGHSRTGIVGQVVFEAENGTGQKITYRDIDAKGIGYSKSANQYYDNGSIFILDRSVQKTVSVGVVKIIKKGQKEVLGLQDLAAAYHDAEMAEAFNTAGIRTDRVLAIIKINEIIDQEGNKITLAEARAKNIISQDITPVISIRSYGTRARVHEAPDKRRYFSQFEDARNMVARELGLNEAQFDYDQYLLWFARTLGENIGKMHKQGWYHHYLSNNPVSPFNVTLDCRFTDRDSVGFLNQLNEEQKKTEIKHDLSDSRNIIRMLRSQIHNFIMVVNKSELEMSGVSNKLQDEKVYLEIFKKAYRKSNYKNQRARQK